LLLIYFIQEQVHHCFGGVGERTYVIENVQEPIIAVLQIGKHPTAEIQRALKEIDEVDCCRFFRKED